MPDKEKSKKDAEDMTSESLEDTTMYDEFIPSFHSWIPSEVQRKRAEELEEPVD